VSVITNITGIDATRAIATHLDNVSVFEKSLSTTDIEDEAKGKWRRQHAALWQNCDMVRVLRDSANEQSALFVPLSDLRIIRHATPLLAHATRISGNFPHPVGPTSIMIPPIVLFVTRLSIHDVT